MKLFRKMIQRKNMIKILAIGNSFSQNATEMVQFFDKNLYVRNMYIAGCSLEMHCENLTGDIKAYEYNHYRIKERYVA